jgi:hypothetical protein
MWMLGPLNMCRPRWSGHRGLVARTPFGCRPPWQVYRPSCLFLLRVSRMMRSGENGQGRSNQRAKKLKVLKRRETQQRLNLPPHLSLPLQRLHPPRVLQAEQSGLSACPMLSGAVSRPDARWPPLLLHSPTAPLVHGAGAPVKRRSLHPPHPFIKKLRDLEAAQAKASQEAVAKQTASVCAGPYEAARAARPVAVLHARVARVEAQRVN